MTTVHLEKKLLTVSDYEAMYQAGILREDERMELLNGEIILMSPTGPKHSGIVNRVSNFIKSLFQLRAIIAVQNPVKIPPNSEPEPDLVILKPREDFYSEFHPMPADIWLIIEVSESTLDKDTLIKLPIYAQAGIPHYWIINIPEKRLEAYSGPTGMHYKLRQLYFQEDTILVPPFDLPVKVSDLVGNW